VQRSATDPGFRGLGRARRELRPPPSRPLENREAAGRLLAAQAAPLGLVSPVVLGIPRGGVPVARPLADALGAPLDVLVVRKLGAPGDPEYGLGAVAEGGVVQLDEARARAAGFPRAELEPEIQRELLEVSERVARYRGGRPLPSLRGHTVYVVDDGVATGGTFETGLIAVRQHAPDRVVAALGVAPGDAVARLHRLADEVLVALVPDHLEAVGQWYRDFGPVPEAEVLELLERGARLSGDPPGATSGPPLA